MSPFRGPHDFPDDPDGAWKKCADCGKTLPADAEELPLCPGPPEERSELRSGGSLRRKKPLRSVSPDRDQKKSSSVTGERLVDSEEACGFAKTRRCFLEGNALHDCERYGGRDPIEPAHVEGKGRGGLDWRIEDGEVVLNVVGACPKAHDVLDGQRPPEEGTTRQGVRAAARRASRRLTDEYPGQPPEHFRKKADGELL